MRCAPWNSFPRRVHIPIIGPRCIAANRASCTPTFPLLPGTALRAGPMGRILLCIRRLTDRANIRAYCWVAPCYRETRLWHMNWRYPTCCVGLFLPRSGCFSRGVECGSCWHFPLGGAHNAGRVLPNRERSSAEVRRTWNIGRGKSRSGEPRRLFPNLNHKPKLSLATGPPKVALGAGRDAALNSYEPPFCIASRPRRITKSGLEWSGLRCRE